MGHFDEDPLRARVEAFGPGHEVIEKRAFELRDYGEPVPVFIRRFGKAYKAEVADFVARCRAGEPFAVTHRTACGPWRWSSRGRGGAWAGRGGTHPLSV